MVQGNKSGKCLDRKLITLLDKKSLTLKQKTKIFRQNCTIEFFRQHEFSCQNEFLPDKSSFSAKTINQFFSAKTAMLINP